MINKYKNKKCELNGIKFDSKSEMEFYQAMIKKNVDIILKPKFELQPKFTKNDKKYININYVGDFQIGNVVIDVKGFPTPVFKMKKKMFEYKFPELTLVELIKCPKVYLGESSPLYEGFIELEKLEKIRKTNKKNKLK